MKFVYNTLSRYEFVNVDEIPVVLVTKPAFINTNAPRDYTIPIKNLSTDSIRLKTNPAGKIDISKTRIFPNPSTNKLFIHLPPGIPATGNLYFKDIYGRVLLKKTINAHEEMLDLNEVAQGVHFLELKIENTILVQRVVVVKP